MKQPAIYKIVGESADPKDCLDDKVFLDCDFHSNPDNGIFFFRKGRYAIIRAEQPVRFATYVGFDPKVREDGTYFLDGIPLIDPRITLPSGCYYLQME